MELDKARYPRVAAYLARLPEGLQSYAKDCQCTAALYRQFLEHKPLTDTAGLPPAIAELVAHPQPVSAWIPEVHFSAIVLALADQHHMSDGDFVQLNYDFNQKFLGGRFFKVLMSLASPRLLFSGAEYRWNAIHRGSKFRVERAQKSSDNSGRAILEFPPHLIPELMLRCYATAFTAALELSNGRNGRVELDEFDDHHAVYMARWE